ncbi:MAG: hypothetical protein ACI8ZM_004437 [Crocinitomix sp.]
MLSLLTKNSIKMLKSKTIIPILLVLGFASCEKEASENEINENQTYREVEYPVGIYHNEILAEVTAEFGPITTESHEAAYGQIKSTAESLMGAETFSYSEYSAYQAEYLPDATLSMDEAVELVDGSFMTTMSSALLSNELITSNEEGIYNEFAVSLFSNTEFENVMTLFETTIDDINTDPELTDNERTRLNYSFDIGLNSANYWKDQCDMGVSSAWFDILSGNGTVVPAARWKWRGFMKAMADLCGGAVGGAAGFVVGGPVGAGVGAVAVGGGISAASFN